MNKFILFGIVLLVFFSLTNSVKANPWGLPRCDDVFWGDIGFGCCHDECAVDERTCDISGNYLIRCGDYDTFFDWDQCYEWPPDDESYWDYCSYGCRNSQCWNTNPCDIGDACIQGDTRCGSTQRGGVSVEAVFQCEYNDNVGCWLWGVDPIQVCELPLYTECGSGQCVTYEQGQESQCSRRQTKCASNFIVGCEDPNMDNIWTWETNPDDWYPCEFGCSEEAGRGQCINERGDVSRVECIAGRIQCNPGFPDYTQVCGLDNEWIIDPDPDPNRYCEFGCHLGNCNREPDPEIACYNCTLGETRCAGAGDYVRECAFDPYTGCLAWVKSWPCESGRCENGVCVERSQSGYAVDISEINETIHGITHDNQYIYVFGREWEDRFNNYSIYTLTYDLQIVDRFNISGYEDIEYTDLAYDGNNLWASRRVNNSHFQLTQFDSEGSLINNYYVFVNTSGGYSGIVKFGGIAIDDTYIYLGSHSNTAINNNRSIVIFYRANLTDSGQTICTLSNPSFPNNNCAYYQLFDSLVYQDGKIYIFKQQFISGNQFLSSSWENTKVEIYGTDGYYYGNFNVTTTPVVSNNEYEGIDYINNQFYFLYPNRQDPENTLLPRPIIEVRYDFTVCRNECFEDASMCGGFSNNYIIPCVQDSNDCWKWYQGDWTCTLTGTCNTTQCIYGCYERWENHRIKKAYCESSPSCENICEPEQVSCSEDGKYVRECELRHVWQTFENEIIPVGGQCYIWNDFTDWEFCGFGDCIDGHCVQSSKCTINETKCFVYTGLETGTELGMLEIDPNLIGTEHVMTCRDVNNDSYYEWDIYSMDFCYWGCNETIVNATTDQSIANCINASGDFANIKNTVYESSVWMGIMFSDPISKYILILIVNMIIFGLFAVGGQWEFGLLGISTVTIIASLIGWMPFEVIIIGIVFAGLFIYNKISMEA